MPRKKMPYEEKLQQIPILVKGKVLDLLGKETIQDESSKAVEKIYKKKLRAVRDQLNELHDDEQPIK